MKSTLKRTVHSSFRRKKSWVFKAAGWPEDVADFYRIQDYEGYSGWRTTGITTLPGGGAAHTLQSPELERRS